jgi:hypothetical protein
MRPEGKAELDPRGELAAADSSVEPLEARRVGHEQIVVSRAVEVAGSHGGVGLPIVGQLDAGTRDAAFLARVDMEDAGGAFHPDEVALGEPTQTEVAGDQIGHVVPAAEADLLAGEQALPVRLSWSADHYVWILDSSREREFLAGTVIEADYSMDLLPQVEYIIRLGRAPDEVNRFIYAVRKMPLTGGISVADIELLKNCFVESLSFFSPAEYEMRTGWTLEEGRRYFEMFMAERRRISIERQWGS